MEFQKEIRQKKGREQVIMLTAYDYQMAKILDNMNIDLILVGDSVGMVVQGNKDTKSVTMEDMIYHTKAVAKGAKSTPIIADMPINSYDTVNNGFRNAKKLLEVGAHGVKIEGNKTEIVEALVNDDIPVMGHVGMLPQMADVYRVKGKKPEEAEAIFRDAVELDRLGVFSMVLECITESLAKRITQNVKIPTIGIGAGKYCDGQVLVTNDMLGLDENFAPKYLKRYADLSRIIEEAIARFAKDVSTGKYPDREHTYH